MPEFRVIVHLRREFIFDCPDAQTAIELATKEAEAMGESHFLVATPKDMSKVKKEKKK